MRFTINKEKFLKALNATSHGVAVKSPNPVLSNVKLDLNEKGLEITGSNAELAIRVTIPYMEGETEGKNDEAVLQQCLDRGFGAGSTLSHYPAADGSKLPNFYLVMCDFITFEEE